MNDLLKDFSLRQMLPALKLLALLILVGVGWHLLKKTPLGASLQDYDWVRLKIAQSGAWGGVVFIAAGALLTVFGLPRMALSVVAGLVFGFLQGFVWAMLAALLGAVVTFYLARALGRDFLAGRLPDNARKYETLLCEHAFFTILAIRFFPAGHNTVTNLVAGISSMRAMPFFLGTFLGYIPQTAIFSMMGSGIGNQPFLRGAVAVGLFLLSILMMYIVAQRIRATGQPEPPDEAEASAEVAKDVVS